MIIQILNLKVPQKIWLELKKKYPLSEQSNANEIRINTDQKNDFPNTALLFLELMAKGYQEGKDIQMKNL